MFKVGEMPVTLQSSERSDHCDWKWKVALGDWRLGLAGWGFLPVGLGAEKKAFLNIRMG